MTKPYLLKIKGLCKSSDTIIVTLNSYNGDYIGLLHIRDPELQAQFKAGNIKKIALIKDKEFISGEHFTDIGDEKND